jgi:hypothetical protein
MNADLRQDETVDVADKNNACVKQLTIMTDKTKPFFMVLNPIVVVFIGNP